MFVSTVCLPVFCLFLFVFLHVFAVLVWIFFCLAFHDCFGLGVVTYFAFTTKRKRVKFTRVYFVMIIPSFSFFYFVFFSSVPSFHINLTKEYFYWNKINANHSFYFSFFSDVNIFSIFSLRILLSYSLSTWGVRHFLRVVTSDCDS